MGGRSIIKHALDLTNVHACTCKRLHVSMLFSVVGLIVKGGELFIWKWAASMCLCTCMYVQLKRWQKMPPWPLACLASALLTYTCNMSG